MSACHIPVTSVSCAAILWRGQLRMAHFTMSGVTSQSLRSLPSWLMLMRHELFHLLLSFDFQWRFVVDFLEQLHVVASAAKTAVFVSMTISNPLISCIRATKLPNPLPPLV